MAQSNLITLAEACKAVVALNDFWVVSELTDNSYEVGTKNVDFRKSINPYIHLGLPTGLWTQLNNGINGNLADALGCAQNKGAGQDWAFGGIETPKALVEVKMVHSVTLSKYYGTIAADYGKLESLREAFTGDLFLVVFFVHFPHYVYPAGNLNGESFPARTFRNDGIRQQFRVAKDRIECAPAWPERGGVYAQGIAEPSLEILNCIQNWCDQFDTTSDWRFDRTHLKNAVVGFAIWQLPPK